MILNSHQNFFIISTQVVEIYNNFAYTHRNSSFKHSSNSLNTLSPLPSFKKQSIDRKQNKKNLQDLYE